MSQIKGIVLCEGEDIILLGDYLSRTKKLFKKDIDKIRLKN